MSHSTHAILVKIPYAAKDSEKNLNEITKEQIKEMVINYATEKTECFYGWAFDYRTLLDEYYEEDADEDYRSVIFADEDWDAFEKVLLSTDKMQKGYAEELLEYLEEQTGTLDLKQILSSLLLVNDRTASKENVDPNTWKWDDLNQGSWTLLEIARLICGIYYFESGFYDTSRGTAHVPFIEKLKEHPEEWALVAFDYHF